MRFYVLDVVQIPKYDEKPFFKTFVTDMADNQRSTTSYRLDTLQQFSLTPRRQCAESILKISLV